MCVLGAVASHGETREQVRTRVRRHGRGGGSRSRGAHGRRRPPAARRLGACGLGQRRRRRCWRRLRDAPPTAATPRRGPRDGGGGGVRAVQPHPPPPPPPGMGMFKRVCMSMRSGDSSDAPTSPTDFTRHAAPAAAAAARGLNGLPLQQDARGGGADAPRRQHEAGCVVAAGGASRARDAHTRAHNQRAGSSTRARASRASCVASYYAPTNVAPRAPPPPRRASHRGPARQVREEGRGGG